MRRELIIIAALVLLVGCKASISESRRSSVLFKAVPSDALAVMVYGNCSDALEQGLDSTDKLRRLSYEGLGKKEAAISLNYLGSLTPLLIINTGHESSDTSSVQSALLRESTEHDLLASLTNVDGYRLALVTSSETVMTSALRHLEMSSSILDAPGFTDVLDALGNGDCLIFRNSGARRLYNFDILDVGLQRREVSNFISTISDWTIVDASDARNGRYSICTVQSDDSRYYANLLSCLEASPSKLSQILPNNALMAIDLPLSASFREAYESRMDARMMLEKYNAGLAAFKKSSKKSALALEKELAVKELATVWIPEGQVNLIRPAKVSVSESLVDNSYTGFVSVLYGKIFVDKDTVCKSCGEWIVSGSREAVEAFEPGDSKIQDWPSKAKTVVYSPSAMLSVTADGTFLNVYKAL